MNNVFITWLLDIIETENFITYNYNNLFYFKTAHRRHAKYQHLN
jgi:hypothetical protein